MEKNHKKSAWWSFIIGLVFILMCIFASLLVNWGTIGSLSLYFSPILAAGLFLGIKGVNSSVKRLSIIGIILCAAGLLPFVAFLLLTIIIFIFIFMNHGDIMGNF